MALIKCRECGKEVSTSAYTFTIIESYRPAPEELDGSRRRDWQDAVAGSNGAPAERQDRRINLFDAQVVECGGRADDVNDRVHRTHFVEMNGVRGDTVYPSLGCGQRCEDRGSTLFQRLEKKLD